MNSNNSDQHPNLFKEFPPVSTGEWERIIKRDLNGKDYTEALRWETDEGINARPFYRREHLDELPDHGPIPIPGGEDNRWKLSQPLVANDPEEANRQALNAIENGAEALRFYLRIRKTDGMLGGDIEGIAVQNQEAFRQLVSELPLTGPSLRFDCGLATPALLAMLINEIERSDTDADSVEAHFLHDPFAFTLRSGQYPKKTAQVMADATGMVGFCDSSLPGARCLGIDARLIHNTGGTIVQELAYALAAGNEYMSHLREHGLTASVINDHLTFSFSVGSSYFLEIAKFRAIRILWKNVLDAHGIPAEEQPPLYLHAESSEWNKTVFDPYTNMLRSTSEGMAAAIAGCDAVTVQPFDRSFSEPDDFSQRIARNTQHILREEAHLDKVRDPSAGSYYIEILTDKLAEQAWNIFQDIEKQGGLLKSIRDGTFQWTIEETRQKRIEAIATRRRIFVGTNQYPNPDEVSDYRPYQCLSTASLLESDNGAGKIEPGEVMVPQLASALREGATLGDLVEYLYAPGKHTIRALSPFRGPEVFEKLRIAVEKREHPPTVLTLPIGNRKWRKARSSFAANLFGCAGYDIEDPIGYSSVEEATNAIKELEPGIVVICSSDSEYEDLVPELCRAIDSLPVTPITVLAGDPGDQRDRYTKAGVDEFIYSGIDVLATLHRFHQQMGIET